MRPRLPETLRPTIEIPVCEHCTRIFLAAFTRANNQRPEEQRLTKHELAAKARGRARAVKLVGEWVCPRCSTLPAADGGILFVEQVYPNRAARRSAGTRKKGPR